MTFVPFCIKMDYEGVGYESAEWIYLAKTRYK
jgi:hypothetical protein